jgi:exosortase C (VPDSG-CTERM-specific)
MRRWIYGFKLRPFASKPGKIMNVLQQPLKPVEVTGADFRHRLKFLAAMAAGLGICFIKPLSDLARFSLHSELFSYVPLIPLISAYLIWTRKQAVPLDWSPAWKSAALAFVAGIALLLGYWWRRYGGWKPALEDYLALMTLSFLLLLLSAGLFGLGNRTLRAVAFPVALLFFMVPYPVLMLKAINIFFDQTSADAASVFFRMAGTPLVRENLVLNLPGFSLQVAPECSGIHSTLVLLITSLLAGNLFLSTGWKRALLTAFVLPLAIARNGFRICVIGELCIHVGPKMIDSPIHHQGGPIFFLLSLIPFFLLLVFLRKSESHRKMDVKPQIAPVTGGAL